MSFMKKVILITGGSSGIGAATAEYFARNGATITVVGRNIEKLNRVVERCKNNSVPALAISADLTKDQEVDLIVEKTVNKFGKLDILINNAGIFKEASILSDNFLETYDQVMNTNIRAPVRIIRFAVPYLIETKGNIVNVSSIAGTCTNNIAYRISKAALNHFTRCAALELAPHGVRVNSISPGLVHNNMIDGTEIKEDTLKNNTTLHKISEINEIVDMIVYVASDKAKDITGSNYVTDNGTLLM